jgi:hypothetical protein
MTEKGELIAQPRPQRIVCPHCKRAAVYQIQDLKQLKAN